MNVLLDHQIFHFQNYGGISRYFVEMLRQNDNDSELNMELAVLHSFNEYIADHRHSSHLQFGKNWDIPGFFRFRLLLNEWNSMKHLKKCDVFHPTFFDQYFLEDIKCPFVVTVYDMINEKFPHYFSGRDDIPEKKKNLMERADKILAISESTKRDILELYNLPEEKIQVVYLASSLHLEDEKSYELPERYLLFVGNRGEYKNFKNFYLGVKDILAPDLKLVCAGGRPFSREENEQFHEDNNSEFVIHAPFNTNSQLKTIYKNAELFIFPSIYEGFGIPVLEAMGVGCPVALSKTAVFEEVAGEAGIYFDPHSIDDIRTTIENYISSPVKLNLESQFNKFSWKKCYEESKSIYQSLV